MGTAAQAKASAALRATFGSRITRLDTGTVVRPIDPDKPTVLSQHSYGNAINIYAVTKTMNSIAVWLVSQADALAVAHVIWNHQSWNSTRRRWVPYNGVDPHTSHVHTDFHPQYAGAPPGYPVGAPVSTYRSYPIPPTLAYPYPTAWRVVVATMLYAPGILRADPATVSLAQLRAGVIEYNRQRGLTPYEQVGQATWDRLDNIVATEGHANYVIGTGQWFLYRYGYLSRAQIDRVFGPVTAQAVARFQADARIRRTGRLEQADWRALEWGPSAWAGNATGPIGKGTWVRPADGQPGGAIAHSWEGTLLGLRPHVAQAADRVNGAARTLRQLAG